MNKLPKTPLKRVSRNSLRTQTLSNSRSEQTQEQTTTTTTTTTTTINPAAHLHHLAPLFADLSDAITDLHINLSNLDLVCQDLDGFNESFAAFIYGLRVNSYLTDFDQAPKLRSFKDALAHKQMNQLEEQANKIQYENIHQNNNHQQEESFISNDRSINNKPTNQPNNKILTHQQLIGSTTTATGPKPKNYTQANKNQQKQLIKFTEKIMPALPLKFREQQPHRHEMELVIILLKLYPNGLLIKDIVKLEPTLAMHRARECATALVAAKKADKFNKDGLLYKLLPE
ncbi:hypothetical protein VP01_1652g5 [Puccinia sorghi]|uniref:DASH complex subunit DAM1 n=1 Tax=Puccinia sorghi TaxID=27349 RepID=A0A0L6VID5_9BASI|nr:hypothetical protein VP01_1652g5 [Puccinia sorghi]